jgi:hypothetical protein
MPKYIGYNFTGTANSSVTTSSLTDIYTSLYLNMDGANNSTTFTDLSPNALTITPNDNSHISTVQSKFGGASVFLDGAGDHLRIPSNIAPLVLTGDFTIECFCRTTTTAGGDRVLLVLNHNSTAAQSIWRIGGTSLRLYSSSGGSWDISNGQTIGTMTADVWHHVAVTRSGNTYNLYLDGVRNTTFSSSLTPRSTGIYSSVGSLVSTTSYDWTGYVDDLRITKGIALYTGATLTVPTSAVTKNIDTLVVDQKYNSGVWSISNSSGSDYSVYGRKLASIWDTPPFVDPNVVTWDAAISSGLYTIDNGGLDVQKTPSSGWGTCAVLSKLMTTADKFSLDVEVVSYETGGYNGYGINLETDGGVVSSPGYFATDVAGRHYGSQPEGSAPAGSIMTLEFNGPGLVYRLLINNVQYKSVAISPASYRFAVQSYGAGITIGKFRIREQIYAPPAGFTKLTA